MNYLEICSFIEAKRKSKAYLEQELHDVRSVTVQLKAAPPVRWYNNFYYIFKRTVLLALVIFSAVFLVSTFVRRDDYGKLFHEQFDGPVSSLINDTFGTRYSVKASGSGATSTESTEVIYAEKVRADIQEKIINNLFLYTLWTVRILLLTGIILFWYAARLTRQLYLKNRQLTAYYDSHLRLMDIYGEVIEEQRYEIQFLEGAARKLY